MKDEAREFQAGLVSFAEIHELPDGWPVDRLQALLASMEVDDVPEQDALEMALLALPDHKVGEAADRILAVIFGDEMRPGVRRNLAHALTEERPWEDFAEMSQQAGIFNAVVLLQQAFPNEFDRPDAAKVVIRIDTARELGRAWLDAPAPDPALLLRILAAGMDERSLLRRLFGDALAGPSFPEAGDLLWRADRRTDAAPAREFELIASRPWFDPLKNATNWTAKAWPDAPAPEDDEEGR